MYTRREKTRGAGLLRFTAVFVFTFVAVTGARADTDLVNKMPQGHPVPPSSDKKFTEAMLSEKLNKGFYLVTIAHCMECHMPMGPRGREFDTKLGAGGFEFPGPWGVSVSRNITSSK